MYNALYHYGVKGMKWGVRRYQNSDGSLTEVGKSHHALAKCGKDGIISGKGFSIHRDKIEKYMLKRGAVRLYKDIERQYDIKNAKGFRKNAKGETSYAIYMKLGVTKKRTFCTAWKIEKGSEIPKFVSAYRSDERA